MEGDAGPSRLNPTGADGSSSQQGASDSPESGDGADSSESAAGTDQAKDAAAPAPGVEPHPSRMGRGWLIVVSVALLLLAGGIGTGGYVALRFHRESQTIARDDAAAIKAAKECVAATQAPDTASMVASQQRIIDCGTGDFGAQAALYSSLLIEAYQAANAHVQVSDMRAAVERNYGDGSIDVLVALRVKISDAQVKDQESGYRLRVRMASDDGQYKIAKLEQVAK